jgi:hypothetical protein
MKRVAALLASGTLALWALGQTICPGPPKEPLESRIAQLERDVAAHENLAARLGSVTALLAGPPTDTPEALFDRIRLTGAEHGFTLTNAVKTGENPWHISLAGYGTYAAAAAVLNEIERTRATTIERLVLTIKNDGLLHTMVEGRVRADAWQGAPLTDPNLELEPEPEPAPTPVIGQRALFGVPVSPPPEAAFREPIRYLGFRTGGATPTLILETREGAVMAVPGERILGNILIRSADGEAIVCEDEGGLRWTVFLEQPR